MAYVSNFILSATAPLTMVRVTLAKAQWNNHLLKCGKLLLKSKAQKYQPPM